MIALPQKWSSTVSINPELMAKINALPDAKLRTEILANLNDPDGKRHVAYMKATNQKYTKDEQIFDLMVETHNKVMEQRARREARMYRWRDDEMLAFIAHFKEIEPQKYADYLYQERNGRQIDADLAWGMRGLEAQWHPGLNDEDYSDLFVKIRHYAQAHLI
jgi:hypothetical protein